MKIYLLIIIIFLLVTQPILGQSKIFINEFLIDPQPQYVEIFNSATESADISDWIIDDSGGTAFYTIPKDSIIFPDQCLVFTADFNLNKTSADTIRLINSSQQLIDSFSYKSSSGSGISYFRLSDGSDTWTTGSANLGWFNSDTKETCLLPTLTLTPTPTITLTPTFTVTPTTTPPPPTETQTPTSTPTPAPQFYENIYLSEVMVSPKTGEKEWVEIYNDNDFSVSLNNWYVDDLENSGSSPKLFSLEINARSYGVFDLGSSIFNNDGDTVRLLDFNKNLKDDFEYQETEQEKTLGRISVESDDFCLQEPSKNSLNNSCINPTPIFIASVKTKQANLPPIKNVDPTNSLIVKNIQFNKPISINQFKVSGQVLGLTNELIINSPDNRSLINLFIILSVSYSLLTISSILFKMKLSYGKDKNFYSSTLDSS
jgi:hypothetical protein